MKRALLTMAGLTALGAAISLSTPSVAHLREWSLLATRPFTLPFLWRSLRQATDSGDPAEAFARAQAVLEVLPEWTDGHAVFAWRYAIDGGNPLATGAARTAAAKERLLAALAMMQQACWRTPAKAADLLVWMAFVVELAAQREPGLGALLAADKGLGTPAQLSDRYLAEAERVSGRASIREQRIFLVPSLCAALLDAKDPGGALNLLDATIARCDEIRDLDLSREWKASLTAVRRRLAGDSTVDPATFRDDQRLAPLLPHLAR